MKVSCIMPTADRRSFIPTAIGYFLAQDYPDKELIILDDGRDNVSDLIPAHPQIRYLRHDPRQPLGRKRNIACAQAQGELIAHWDDDDWYAPFRLRRQVAALRAAGADICGIDRVLFFDADARRAWEYVYPPGQTPWVYGATLCYTKSFWRDNPFPEIDIGEDTRFIFAARGARIEVMPDNDIFVGMIHRANTSPKRMRDPQWQKRPIEAVEAVMRQPLRVANAAAPLPTPELGKPAALVTAAAGIGDIVRMTPLVRVLHGLGYDVDLMLSPDDPACLELFRGAPELRRVIHVPAGAGQKPIPELAQQRYALATFTPWSAPLASAVDATDRHVFGRAEWRTQGDIRSVEKIARALGWQGPLPAPFVRPSERRFDLPAGTVALHPGCKLEWPWKKWHGFEALAGLLPHVVIVGGDADRDNSATYFKRAFAWPGHARDFTGTLSLTDTAALIGQCAALVANDSGLMHVGVALGVPTFGIFGITSPAREIIPSPSMIPVTKQLRCEAGCRREPWGRRDCDHHLECLKMLTADEVLARVHERLPELRPPPPPEPRAAASTDTVRLNYYGYVFDASGYGQAARAYIHALHAAGVKLSVIDLAGHPPQTDDALVMSLLGNDDDADFNLLHAIPSYWPSAAPKLRNMIAMTVWETDTMPSQWHVPLAKAIDVWLPCHFNAAAFSRGLNRQTFVLPHAAPPTAAEPSAACPVDSSLVADGDFVFYSIFEWQDRKNPGGMIKAFLRAFPDANDAVLVLKTNPGAAAEAHAMLRKIRAGTRLQGRVVLCCEAWSEAQLRAFHARGDCYVSLHKGEGWGYPLFEAAMRGKPVVATDYSAPQDYLDRQHHWLVRCSTAPVRQNYQFYRFNMKWAEPDVAHASEGLRWIYGNRDEARAGAAQAGRRLAADFSIDRIGASAKARLLELRSRTAPATAATIARRTATPRRNGSVRGTSNSAAPVAGAPIPGKWYDADYFEHGRKSNWAQGYRWPLFQNVFEGAAAYMAEMFPDARSFLDIGCAKGFLVRALRARQLDAWGFDHSPFAVRNADPAAKRFVSLADAATATCGRQFDVLVAMSIFESLTEAQLAVVLPRIRPWAGQALFAVIPTLESGAERLPGVDRDLSHITLRDRAWWEQRFIAAGWRPFADGFEERCRAHPFAVQMEWSVYVLSPDR